MREALAFSGKARPSSFVREGGDDDSVRNLSSECPRH